MTYQKKTPVREHEGEIGFSKSYNNQVTLEEGSFQEEWHQSPYGAAYRKERFAKEAAKESHKGRLWGDDFQDITGLENQALIAAMGAEKAAMKRKKRGGGLERLGDVTERILARHGQ